LASKSLRGRREDLFEALQAEEVTPAHRFVLSDTMPHIEELETRMARFDAEVIRSLEAADTQPLLRLLQTCPDLT